MNEILKNLLEDGEWCSLRFTVYNYLEEQERYQQNLEKLGYENSYDDLVSKTIKIDNETANEVKDYVENKIQNGKIVVAICVLENSDYLTIVKPKDVDINTILKLSQT